MIENDGSIVTFPNADDELSETATAVKAFLTLEDVLGKDTDELRAVASGEFNTEKLGLIPYSAITYPEYKQAKKDCVKFEPDGSGGMKTEIDDDRLMVKIILAATAKDTRSNFTFANKALLEKLDVATAEASVGILLSPGEIVNFAVAVQNLSGFGKKKAKANADAIKNS